MMKILPRIILILTISLWFGAGWRVVATQTGQFGPVQVSVKQLDVANKFVRWSPQVTDYNFNSEHNLTLPAESTALFLLNPPPHFSRGTVMITASGLVDLQAEYPPDTPVTRDTSNIRTWRWSEITRFPGGHRLRITNLTDAALTVSQIKIIFTP